MAASDAETFELVVMGLRAAARSLLRSKRWTVKTSVALWRRVACRPGQDGRGDAAVLDSVFNVLR